MKLSEQIQILKDKGNSAQAALRKIKLHLQQQDIDWTEKKQEIFNKVFGLGVHAAPPTIPVNKPDAGSTTPTKHISDPVLAELAKDFAKMDSSLSIGAGTYFYKKLWHYYNAKFFSNELPLGTFRYTKDTGQYFRTRAHYRPSNNELSFNRRLFNASFDKFCEIFVHEMCHQAVRQIDKYFGTNGSKRDVHGAVWAKWMRHCGLDPERCDKSDQMDYMEEHEKKAILDIRSEREKQLQDKVRINPKPKTIAQVYVQKDKVWIKGWIVCPDPKKAGRWAFVNKCEGTSYWSIPNDMFYELPHSDPDSAELRILEWSRYATYMHDLIQTNKAEKVGTMDYSKAYRDLLSLVPSEYHNEFMIIIYALTKTELKDGHGTYSTSAVTEQGQYTSREVRNAFDWAVDIDSKHLSFTSSEYQGSLLKISPVRDEKLGAHRTYTIGDFFIALFNFYGKNAFR